ncbi:MAG: type IV pilus twitching motility protein PilT [Candidatus Sumerlaeaceae bacterium]
MAQLDQLFSEMLAMNASDLHLHEGQQPKVRVHGSLQPLSQYPEFNRLTMKQILREICTPERWKRFEESGDLDFAYAYENFARFRANYKKHYHGYGAVFRTIPSRILTLEELGVPDVLRSFASFSSGLCLVTGPTGSGKSTTLAAVIDFINTTQRRTILTIEEPIEFVHPAKESVVTQREVGTDVRTFGEGLRGVLRQDIEVVLVGEMRDLETISLAVTAAEMGMLVFGTLHTNSATKTIDRIIDVFPNEQQAAIRESLAVALRAVCAQLLIKTADGKGRVAAHEVLLQNRAVSNMIREARTGQLNQVIQSSRALGMQTMDDTIENLLKSSRISGHDAYMKALDKERFQQYAPAAIM